MTSLCGCWLRSRPDSLGFCPSDRSPHDRACNARPRAWRVRSDLKRKGVTMSRMSVNHIAVLLAIGAIVPMQSFVSRARQVFPAASNTIADIRELSDGRVVVASMAPSLSLFDRTGSVLWKHDALGTDFSDQAATLKVSLDGKQVLFHFDRNDDKSLATFDISTRALDLSPAQRPELIAARVEGLPIRKLKENFLQSKGTKSPAALPLHTTLAVSGLEATGAFATSMPQAL